MHCKVKKRLASLEAIALMLAYPLAIIIAIGSFCYYMAAFFVPEIHRRQDFFWSGVGMFYALVLWECAGRITGAVLLGQIASVTLLGWLGWQTLELRRALTPELVRTPVSWAKVGQWWSQTGQALRKYLQAGSWGAALQAIGSDIRAAIAQTRDRIAGPRPQKPAAATLPTRRSPAYEFETDTGQGESVPAEFSPITTQPRPGVSGSVPRASQIVPGSSAPAHPAPIRIAPESADIPATQALSRPEPSPRSPITAASNTQPGPAPSTQANVPKRSTPPPDGWFVNIVKRLRKPKPKRAVIEIPPRPPSIPRASVSTPDSKPWASADGHDANGVDREDANTMPPASEDKPTAFTDNTARDESSGFSRQSDPHSSAPEISPELGASDTNWPEESIHDDVAFQDWPMHNADPVQTVPLDESDTNWPEEYLEADSPQDKSSPNLNEPATYDESETNWPD